MALPTAQNLKDYLRVETTAEDSVIAAILASATALAAVYLDRPITAVARTYTVEDRRAASLGLSRLSYDPSAATFIRVPDAPVDITQPITITDRFGTVLDSTQYRVEAATGVVRNGGANTAYGGVGLAGFPYTIVATTGLATRADYATVVEPAVFQAILDIGADLYQRRNPAATDENDGAGGSIRYGRNEETIPTRAVAMLDPFPEAAAMTLSRRDRRIGVYTYANTGREGVIVDTWTLAGTYWGRVDDYRGSSRMVAGAPEIAVDSVIQLSDEHYVAPNSIAVDGTLLLDASFNLDGAQSISGQPGSGTAGVFRIDRLLRKRMHRVQLLYAQRINRNSVNLAALVLDGAFILDGSAVLGGILSS